jgi:hypothetical protein
MKYIMLIYQGTALERQAALPEEEQKQVYADYQGINQTPGVTPGLPMGLPQNATTVRVEGGKTLTTDGPFIGMKEAVPLGETVNPAGTPITTCPTPSDRVPESAITAIVGVRFPTRQSQSAIRTKIATGALFRAPADRSFGACMDARRTESVRSPALAIARPCRDSANGAAAQPLAQSAVLRWWFGSQNARRHSA